MALQLHHSSPSTVLAVILANFFFFHRILSHFYVGIDVSHQSPPHSHILHVFFQFLSFLILSIFVTPCTYPSQHPHTISATSILFSGLRFLRCLVHHCWSNNSLANMLLFVLHHINFLHAENETGMCLLAIQKCIMEKNAFEVLLYTCIYIDNASITQKARLMDSFWKHVMWFDNFSTWKCEQLKNH